MTSDVQSNIQYFSNIKHDIYYSFDTNKYLQNPKVDFVENWFFSSKKPISKTILYNKKLHHIFFMLMDPLKSIDEMIQDMTNLLGENKSMLKEITPHYKKLYETIIMLISDNKNDIDLSYTNEKYMKFWSHLLHANIYIIMNHELYYVYNKNTQQNNDQNSTKDIIIRYSKEVQSFEYISGSFQEYSEKASDLVHTSIFSLQKISIGELRGIYSRIFQTETSSNLKRNEIIKNIISVS